MINIAICDDVKNVRDYIIHMCDEYSNNNGIIFSYKEFSSGIQIFDYEGHIDILFLDIQILGMNGIEVMEKLDGKENVDIIIFVSGYDNYCFNVFSSKTRGFLKKPVSYDVFEQNIKRAINEIERKKIIEFETEQKRVFIRNDDLIYIETMGNYVKIYCKGNMEYIVYGSMKKWSERLEDYGVIRVSSSYMVNLRYVREWEKIIKLENINKKIQVGRKYYQKGREVYYAYVRKRLMELIW